jgi:predicted Zn-ribbon and HTH transcriptional regulator
VTDVLPFLRGCSDPIFQAAADEIERLRADLEHKDRYYAQFDLVPKASVQPAACTTCGGKGYVPRNNPLHPFSDKRCPDCGGDRQTPL